jgi:hypothetical protein
MPVTVSCPTLHASVRECLDAMHARKLAYSFKCLNPAVTVRTASLTFSNSTFCPHSVFMCFVWISEQTAIISLYSINWLVFITETECVYCAVRTEFLCIIHHAALSAALIFYNRDGVCLLRGTSWSSGNFNQMFITRLPFTFTIPDEQVAAVIAVPSDVTNSLMW